jgi:hypothetical protein
MGEWLSPEIRLPMSGDQWSKVTIEQRSRMPEARVLVFEVDLDHGARIPRDATTWGYQLVGRVLLEYHPYGYRSKPGPCYTQQILDWAVQWHTRNAQSGEVETFKTPPKNIRSDFRLIVEADHPVYSFEHQPVGFGVGTPTEGESF